MHFAIYIQVWVRGGEKLECAPHLPGGLGVIAPEVGMGEQSDLGYQPEAANMGCSADRHFDDLGGRRLRPYLRVGKEIRALAGNDQRERGEVAAADRKSNDVADVAQMAHEAALHAANH